MQHLSVHRYGYGVQDPKTGDVLFCGPYTMKGAAGCMVSSDGGHHFRALPLVSPPAALTEHSWSEQQMTRLTALGADHLMMLGHGRGNTKESSDFLISVSANFGRNWSVPSQLTAVRQPGCQGSLLAVGDIVVVSHPNNGTGYLPDNHDPARNHMTLSYSRRGWDSGWKQWKHHLVFYGYSGYSAMQDLSVGSAGEPAIGLIYERGTKRFDEDVWVAVVPLYALNRSG
jgi:hypothetical protein